MAEARRKVTLIKDHTLDYPTLSLAVYVEPDPVVKDDPARFAKMFARAGCRRADTPEAADLVVFGGGSDVNPALYGEAKHNSTFFSDTRDSHDMDIYIKCLEKGIPMFGVCRGAQFLHVMNGGKLYQDVDNHYGDHPIIDLNSRQRIDKISSVHHQMVIQNIKGGMEVIATANKSNERWMNNVNCIIGDEADIEAFFYRETLCFGVQGHPEYEGYNFFTKWCLDLINELIFNSPDITWESGNLRIKEELLKERLLLANLPKKLEKEKKQTLTVTAKKEK